MKNTDNTTSGMNVMWRIVWPVLILCMMLKPAKADEKEGVNTIRNSKDAVSRAKRWDFNRANDTQGWTIPERLTGAAIGGSLWLTIQPKGLTTNQLGDYRYQVWGHQGAYVMTQSELESPRGLEIPACRVKKVRMRIINLSPETDGYLFWRTKEKPGKDAGRVRFTMKPDCKNWQVVLCHVDNKWSGTIDRIRLRFDMLQTRGDIWIDWIEIADGPVRAPLPRPDVCSKNVVPQISIPGISQQDFQDAFNVLDEIMIIEVPVYGFNYPVMAPGGKYGQNWWQIDSSINIAGSKWANQDFAEGVIRGFIGVQSQNPDGRIDLYGLSHLRGQIASVSSLPLYFEYAYDIARRTGDQALREEIYQSMKKYLDWWLTPVKKDGKTGLITGIFEEAMGTEMFRIHHGAQTFQMVAPLDLNVAVALGAYNVRKLAQNLGKNEDAKYYAGIFDQLKDSINRYMWNQEKACYFNYNVKQQKQIPRLMCTTFDTMRLGIASPQQVEKLIEKLLNPALFNWGKLPVTSIAMTEPDYVEAKGTYNGSAWFGDIWALRNMPIIAGLKDVGRHDLAAELAWSTIKAFNANYYEYLVPSTGEGHGVKRYGEPASMYIQALIEHLFGIDYDRTKKRLRIVPHIPAELINQKLSIRNLIIPTAADTRLNMTVIQTDRTTAEIAVDISGKLPEGTMEILLPKPATQISRITDAKGKLTPIIEEAEGLVNVVGTQMPISNSVKLLFE